MVVNMRKVAYIDNYWGEGWPEIKSIERYFIAPPGKRWVFDSGNPDGSLMIEGVDGTSNFDQGRGRVDTCLTMIGKQELGVLLIYSKKGGGYNQTYNSKGDVTRLREFVRTYHNTLVPVGLLIPFDRAWKAVKEFMQTNGVLPRSIEWISDNELPPNTFPAPHELKI
jgi:hypothetical protein